MQNITILILLLFPFYDIFSHPENKPTPISRSDEKIQLNFDLIHTLSKNPTSADSHPAKLPYYVIYKKGNKKLIYLSTPHTKNIQSQSHQMIKKILASTSLKSVIVEMPTYDDKILKKLLDYCDVNKECVESVYAYKLASLLKLDVIGGEPHNLEILKNSIKLGMTTKEVIFFYTFRKVAMWRQSNPDKAYHPPNPINEIKKYIESSKKRLRLRNHPFSYKDFTEIYKKGMKKPFNYKKTAYEDIAPYKDGHYIQKLAVIIDQTRENSILKIIQDKINQYSEVFVIYGSGHFLKHRPVLKEAFDSERISL